MEYVEGAVDSGAGTPQFPSIIGGNPQGYVVIEGLGTGEAPSGDIQVISSSASGNLQISSINHCVTASNPLTGLGDFLYFQGVLGLLTSTITNITQGSFTVLTTTNTFSTGNVVTISGVVGMTQLNGNTYEIISATGTTLTLNVDSRSFSAYISGGTVTSAINGLIGKVVSTPDANTFVVDLLTPVFTSVYLGLGTYSRLCHPLLQTKQFNPYWDQGRKVRLSVQKYLLDMTTNAQISVNIYLSQDPVLPTMPEQLHLM